jgi:hypothetical protein
VDKIDFQQAKEFIYADIKRELDLVRADGSGGNFMLALALLCYTEFAGGLKRGVFKIGQSKRNFDAFLDDLGPTYRELRKTVNIYGVASHMSTL